MTITEALAEIKTITNRIQKKRAFVRSYSARQRILQDPFAEEGGVRTKLRQELQALADLQTRQIELRLAVLRANLENRVTVKGTSRSIQEWLTWRREVAPGEAEFVSGVLSDVAHMRSEAGKRGGDVGDGPAKTNADIAIHVDESRFNTQNEYLVEVLGELDGQLSVANATLQI